jgi:hypothetical protein
MSPPDKPRSGGDTHPTRENRSEPRLPHEHDESADSQERSPDHERVGRQAHADVERGLVDTDRGPVIERVNDVLNEQASHRPPHKRGA